MAGVDIMRPDKRRLRRFLALFFIALVVPSAVLTWQAYSRLKWESFHRYQVIAEDLLGRVDRRVRDLVVKEERRAFADYRFLVLEGAPGANFLQRSPLASLPVDSDIPGLLGYFQVDANGRFTTPLLPDEPAVSARSYGFSDTELRHRQALRERLLSILSQEQRPSLAQAEDSKVDVTDEEAAGGVSPKERREDRDGTPFGSALAVPAATEATKSADAKRSSLRTQVSKAHPPAGAPGGVRSGGATGEKEQRLAQAAFDRLSEAGLGRRAAKKKSATGNIGRVDELRLDRAFGDDVAGGQVRSPLPRFKERIEYGAEQDVMSEPRASVDGPPVTDRRGATPVQPPALVNIFESELDPFQFGLIGEGHFVLYRKVWRQGQRYIQGAVIEKSAFLDALIETSFRSTALAGMSRLGIVFDDEILSALGGQQGRSYLSSSEQLSGTLLYRGRLSSPLDRFEFIYSVTNMPVDAAGSLVIWVALALGLVLCGGFLLMYRLGAKQIELNQQQRDFVSAVSHELKTPLTSIRMYSEMLREGWADEKRQRSYYDFIFDESERLSRLITNVLQLARLSRDDLKVEQSPATVTQLIDMVRAKVSTQIAHADFMLDIECDEEVGNKALSVDNDAFAQIMINLVDNAIKFSAKTENGDRQINIGAGATNDGRIEFVVRDHGPGIPRDQLKKIFRLFYRTENELTRETVGTGIGLALVHRLTMAMQGEVDVVNREPGAEFRLRFPCIPSQSLPSSAPG